MFDIQKAKQDNNFRELKHSSISSKFLNLNGKRLLNLGSNDYLGIASNRALRDEFLQICLDSEWYFGSGASRLVYTSSDEFERLESWFENKFKKSALIFNSGYCANLSCISALNSDDTLFIADKLIHASMIDALKLSNANFKRYAHNDNEALESLVKQNYDKFKRIIILSEAIFSMDGDRADIEFMLSLKRRYDNIMLYIDEAHSFFALNELGICGDMSCDIDFILVTLSKAVGSSGAVLLGSKEYKDIFINSARSLIYSTSIPPINVAWSNFILAQDHSKRRENLVNLINYLNLNSTHICPFVVGENAKALELSKALNELGYFVPAIRPPTVPSGKARLRISLRADLQDSDLMSLKRLLDEN
ncbi:aminotransferase class I/II-fold pyridoxal phosphate-dependent enzyme [Campylobacter vicugnae]|uniref:8-amino-7-oxononanoate synthase n=1 Tax=Campylobacter vicugnae TaxID=1660076 RepID=A0ABZ2E858_9BACT|nr:MULTISPECIES: 8-amino-7-oxononanoate synthase [unclassified Campylobacter]ARR03292.1 8-amino-7-oxononanoate synthase [Campylobacter sp. RM12175]